MSKREQKTKMLLDELIFCEMDEIAKVVATEIPWRMLVRILNKFRRLRKAPEICNSLNMEDNYSVRNI